MLARLPSSMDQDKVSFCSMGLTMLRDGAPPKVGQARCGPGPRSGMGLAPGCESDVHVTPRNAAKNSAHRKHAIVVFIALSPTCVWLSQTTYLTWPGRSRHSRPPESCESSRHVRTFREPSFGGRVQESSPCRC